MMAVQGFRIADYLQSSHARSHAVLQTGQAGQTSAASAHCCSASGTPPKMHTSAALSSHLTIQGRFGGCAINAQMGILMNGRQQSATGPMAEAVLTVLTKPFVSTVPLPAKPHTLSQNGTQQRILTHHMITQSQLITMPIGDVSKVINGKLELITVLRARLVAQSVSRLDPDRGFQS